MKRVSIILCLLAFVLAYSPPASATVALTLTDQNSVVNIDPNSSSGVMDWFVDGVDILYQQWFWYRVGAAGGESSVDTLSALTTTLLDPATVKIAYSTAQLRVEILYGLFGGSPGSHESDLSEAVRITNLSGSSLDLHFFQYSNFDLAPDLVDNATLTPSFGHAHQVPVNGGMMLSETVATPQPTHAEANYFANTVNALNDGNPTTLNDVLTAGPGNVTWAFEWDVTLADGGTFIVSKDKRIAPVIPEPTTIGLLGAVLLFVARRLRSA